MSLVTRCLDIAYYTGLIHSFLAIDRVLGGRRVVAVIFHRIVEDGADSQLITGVSRGTSRSQFAAQLRVLSRWFRPVSLKQLDALLTEARPPERDACLITFDDAYDETLTIAAPLLIEHEAAACVFVATAFVGNKNRFWFVRVPDVLQQASKEQWQTLKQDSRLSIQFAKALEHTSVETLNARRETWRRISPVFDTATEEEREQVLELMESVVPVPTTPYMSILDWEQLKQVEKLGIEIGGHTHLHPKLTTVATTRVESELTECWKQLGDQLPQMPLGFAYPSGDYDDRIVHCLESSPFQMAFTTRIGLIHTQKANRYELPRVYLPDGPPKKTLIVIAMLKLSKYMPRGFLVRVGRFLGQRII